LLGGDSYGKAFLKRSPQQKPEEQEEQQQHKMISDMRSKKLDWG